MKKTKMEKGITLVALIITIVVLLILAVVSINSIINDGMIGKAEGSADKFNKAQGNEQGILGTYENIIKDYDGISAEKEVDPVEVDFMEKYILGEEGTGRLITEIVTLDSNMQITSFIDDTSTTEINEAEEITPLVTFYGTTNAIAQCFAKYNNKIYKMVADNATYMTKSVEVIYVPQGREGTTVAYDSNGDGTTEDWVIITDRDGKVEIVSANVMGSLQLGGTDPEIKNNLIKYLDLNKDGIPDDLDGDGVIEEGGTDLDGDGTTEVDYQDIAIASYNNAITTINNYCKSLVTATDNDGVRSVGGTNNSWTPYSSTNYDNWGEAITVDVASGDLQFETDYAKMWYWGIAGSDAYYWQASRLVYESSSGVDFSVRRVYAVGLANDLSLWYVYSDGNVLISNPSYGVRPVVINPSGI